MRLEQALVLDQKTRKDRQTQLEGRQSFAEMCFLVSVALMFYSSLLLFTSALWFIPATFSGVALVSVVTLSRLRRQIRDLS